VKMRHPNTNDETSTFKDEFKVLDKYRSPYIVAVVGYWELESWLDTRPWVRNATKCPFLLMEAMECDLQGLITKYRESRRGMQEGFSALETIKIMLPIAKALRFLHEKDVAHRDVKLQNIMCSNVQNIMCSGDFDDAIVKLIDFGEATVGVSKISSKTHRPAGTKGYMDPEMWKLDPKTRKRKGYNLFRADVFSFAMVFVELLTWRLPWGISAREVQDELNNGERPALPNDLPDYVSFIVECCWCVDPTARPTFADICSMLQNAKLLLLDKNIFGNQDDLFCYLDGDCIDRNIGNRAFLH
jgi:serine/threonine protein kinase